MPSHAVAYLQAALCSELRMEAPNHIAKLNLFIFTDTKSVCSIHGRGWLLDLLKLQNCVLFPSVCVCLVCVPFCTLCAGVVVKIYFCMSFCASVCLGGTEGMWITISHYQTPQSNYSRMGHSTACMCLVPCLNIWLDLTKLQSVSEVAYINLFSDLMETVIAFFF